MGDFSQGGAERAARKVTVFFRTNGITHKALLTSHLRKIGNSCPSHHRTTAVSRARFQYSQNGTPSERKVSAACREKAKLFPRCWSRGRFTRCKGWRAANSCIVFRRWRSCGTRLLSARWRTVGRRKPIRGLREPGGGTCGSTFLRGAGIPSFVKGIGRGLFSQKQYGWKSGICGGAAKVLAADGACPGVCQF